MAFEPQAAFAIFLAALPYLPLSLLLAVLPIVLGLPLAFALALPDYLGSRVAWLARLWIAIVRATPLVLTLLLTYFLLQAGVDGLGEGLGIALRGSFLPLPAIAVIAFTIGISPGLAEAVRAALISVLPGQIEAARAMGMTRVQTLRRVIVPQAVPVLMPQLGNIFIGCFKATAIAYLISVTDVLNAATMEAARTYQYSEAYVAAAAIYWTVCLLAGRIVGAAERLARRKFWGDRTPVTPRQGRRWSGTESLQ